MHGRVRTYVARIMLCHFPAHFRFTEFVIATFSLSYTHSARCNRFHRGENKWHRKSITVTPPNVSITCAVETRPSTEKKRERKITEKNWPIEYGMAGNVYELKQTSKFQSNQNHYLYNRSENHTYTLSADTSTSTYTRAEHMPHRKECPRNK